MPILTRAERETIIRWDDDGRTLDIYTASPLVARRLIKRGYPMQPEKPWGWRAKGVPLKALSFRRLETLTKVQNAARLRSSGKPFQKRDNKPLPEISSSPKAI